MLQFIVDALLVILGMVGSKIIFSSLYKPKSSIPNVLVYVFGALTALLFYSTWAATGMDPIQLSICTMFENAPVCMEKRSRSAVPEYSPQSNPISGEESVTSKLPKSSAMQPTLKNPGQKSLYARCAGSYEPGKCIQEEILLAEQSPSQARERAAILDKEREVNMVSVNNRIRISQREPSTLEVEREKNMSIVNSPAESPKPE